MANQRSVARCGHRRVVPRFTRQSSACMFFSLNSCESRSSNATSSRIDSIHRADHLQSILSKPHSERNRYRSDHAIQHGNRTRTFRRLESGLKVRSLPDRLLQSIEALLDDPQERIRTAAAITLTTLRRFSSKVGLIGFPCMRSS